MQILPVEYLNELIEYLNGNQKLKEVEKRKIDVKNIDFLIEKYKNKGDE